jgi:hypothetical protein
MLLSDQRKPADRSAELDLAAYAAAAERLTRAVREAARAAPPGARGLSA